nr:pre-mRNA splicing Prp18-interacting factor [Tanacetum cinerariifolium]
MSTFVLCVGCGTPLYGFSPCQWCTCELCGNDLRDRFCSLCNSRNSCVYDPNRNSFDCPPDSCHPPHPTYETYSCDSYGNDSHFGYDCQPQFPLNYESDSGYIENYNSYPYDSSRFPQQELCCEDCGVLPEAHHCQTPQYTVNHPIFNAHNDFLDSQNKITIAQNKIMEQMKSLTSMCEMACQIIQKKQEEKRIKEEQAANARYWKIPACCDDDDDYDSAITPNEPNDCLSMGDEHLNTISATESMNSESPVLRTLSQTQVSLKVKMFMPACFTTFSNILFDADYEFDSSDDQSLFDEDFSEEIFLNPLINSLLYEFADELTLLKSIPSGIDKTDCYPEEEIRLTKRLLYDNSSPRSLEEFVAENSDV